MKYYSKSSYRGRGTPPSHTLTPLGRFAPSHSVLSRIFIKKKSGHPALNFVDNLPPPPSKKFLRTALKVR